MSIQKCILAKKKEDANMQENTNFTQNIDTVFTDLHNFIKTDTVLGTPMVVGDKTLVPLMSITLGYGSTAMGAKAPAAANANATSGGMGLGAKVTTNGVIVIEKEKVQILPTNDKGMSQMMDKLPQALASVGSSMLGGQGQQQAQGQNQPQQGSQQAAVK